MALVDSAWMPDVPMKRVICHWTAGGYKANSIDRNAYHVLVQGDGTLVRGTHSIADNVSTGDGRYAAHTLGSNTGSIGVSCCCMADCQEKPFRPGPFPMREVQWETMTRVVAELCRFYRIPVTPKTVLGHGEVQVNLGIKQKNKWDPMVLPWQPELSRTEVGTLLRTLVSNHLEGGATRDEPPVPVRAVVRGKVREGFMLNGSLHLPAKGGGGTKKGPGTRGMAPGVGFRSEAEGADVEEGPRLVEIGGATFIEVANPDDLGVEEVMEAEG